VMGVQMAGILMAGIGLGSLGVLAVRLSKRVPPRSGAAAATLVLLAALVLVLSPAWRERARVAARGAGWMAIQRGADQTVGGAGGVMRSGPAIRPGTSRWWTPSARPSRPIGQTSPSERDGSCGPRCRGRADFRRSLSRGLRRPLPRLKEERAPPGRPER